MHAAASGWAFSTVAGIEGLLHNVTGNLVELSVQQLIDYAVTNYTFAAMVVWRLVPILMYEIIKE